MSDHHTATLPKGRCTYMHICLWLFEVRKAAYNLICISFFSGPVQCVRCTLWKKLVASSPVFFLRTPLIKPNVTLLIMISPRSRFWKSKTIKPDRHWRAVNSVLTRHACMTNDYRRFYVFKNRLLIKCIFSATTEQNINTEIYERISSFLLFKILKTFKYNNDLAVAIH